jgi:hypothetical protein
MDKVQKPSNSVVHDRQNHLDSTLSPVFLLVLVSVPRSSRLSYQLYLVSIVWSHSAWQNSAVETSCWNLKHARYWRLQGFSERGSIQNEELPLPHCVSTLRRLQAVLLSIIFSWESCQVVSFQNGSHAVFSVPCRTSTFILLINSITWGTKQITSFTLASPKSADYSPRCARICRRHFWEKREKEFRTWRYSKWVPQTSYETATGTSNTFIYLLPIVVLFSKALEANKNCNIAETWWGP